MKRHGQAVASNSIVSQKSVYVVLGIRTRGCTIVGADETTELWRPTISFILNIDLLKMTPKESLIDK